MLQLPTAFKHRKTLNVMLIKHTWGKLILKGLRLENF